MNWFVEYTSNVCDNKRIQLIKYQPAIRQWDCYLLFYILTKHGMLYFTTSSVWEKPCWLRETPMSYCKQLGNVWLLLLWLIAYVSVHILCTCMCKLLYPCHPCLLQMYHSPGDFCSRADSGISHYIYLECIINTLRPNKKTTILQTTFSNVFLQWKWLRLRLQ